MTHLGGARLTNCHQIPSLLWIHMQAPQKSVESHQSKVLFGMEPGIPPPSELFGSLWNMIVACVTHEVVGGSVPFNGSG